MWSYILQNIVLSILIVALAQYLWDYFKSTYSTRKTKDIVDFQTKKYREIFKTMHDPPTTEQTSDMYISPDEKEKMINELLSFIECHEPRI
jgi:hypothetical protein